MTKWIIDSDHSSAAFAVKHMMLAHIHGQFNVRGTIEFEPENRSGTTVEIEIEVATVKTGIKKRDEHLLTADFFDQPRYPLITFKSTKVDFPGGNRCRVSGNLSLHGVTRPVMFEGEYAGPRGNPFGDELSIGFCGSTTINREEFGMMWGSEPLEGGGFVAGKEVQLFLDVEADRVE